MTNANVWTLYPGACEPIACKTGHQSHMSLASTMIRLLIGAMSAVRNTQVHEDVAQTASEKATVRIKASWMILASLKKPLPGTFKNCITEKRPFNLTCVLSPLHMLLPSATGWTRGVKFSAARSFINIRPVRAQLFHTDGQTDKNSVFSQFCERAWKPQNQKHKKFPYNVMTSQAYRLPTWHYKTLKPTNAPHFDCNEVALAVVVNYSTSDH